MELNGLEYPISERNNNFLNDSNFPYESNNKEIWHDKKFIRVYNRNDNKHYYFEQCFPKIGDSNLVFITFPRTDAPVNSWTHATQHATIRTWAKPDLAGEFVRFKILSIDKYNYCSIDDGYNKPAGAYALDCFYKINKIM